MDDEKRQKRIKTILSVIAIFLVFGLGMVAIISQIENKALTELLLFGIEETQFCANYHNLTFDELQDLFLENKTQEILNQDKPNKLFSDNNALERRSKE